jgi:hypothetical protein
VRGREGERERGKEVGSQGEGGMRSIKVDRKRNRKEGSKAKSGMWAPKRRVTWDEEKDKCHPYGEERRGEERRGEERRGEERRGEERQWEQREPILGRRRLGLVLVRLRNTV